MSSLYESGQLFAEEHVAWAIANDVRLKDMMTALGRDGRGSWKKVTKLLAAAWEEMIYERRRRERWQRERTRTAPQQDQRRGP